MTGLRTGSLVCTPGDGNLIIGSSAIALVGEPLGGPLTAVLIPAIDQLHRTADVASLLVSSGFVGDDAGTPFALLLFDAGEVRVLVRGIDVHTAVGDSGAERAIEGTDVSTWAEHRLGDVERVSVTFTSDSLPGTSKPVDDILIRAASVAWERSSAVGTGSERTTPGASDDPSGPGRPSIPAAPVEPAASPTGSLWPPPLPSADSDLGTEFVERLGATVGLSHLHRETGGQTGATANRVQADDAERDTLRTSVFDSQPYAIPPPVEPTDSPLAQQPEQAAPSPLSTSQSLPPPAPAVPASALPSAPPAMPPPFPPPPSPPAASGPATAAPPLDPPAALPPTPAPSSGLAPAAPPAPTTQADAPTHSPPVAPSQPRLITGFPAAAPPDQPPEVHPSARDSSRHETTDQPQEHLGPVPDQVGPSHERLPDGSASATSSPSSRGDLEGEPGEEDLLTVARPSTRSVTDGTVSIPAVHCPSRHPNPPHSDVCRICDQPLVDRTITVVPRPVLGLLRFSNGSLTPVEGPLLLGRRPSVDHTATGSVATAIVLNDPERGLSRNHAEIRVSEWQVHLVDLDSMTGTFIEVPGRAPFRLRPAEPYPMPLSTRVSLGDIVQFTFEPHGRET